MLPLHGWVCSGIGVENYALCLRAKAGFGVVMYMQVGVCAKIKLG
jgi:hypothetical protein